MKSLLTFVLIHLSLLLIAQNWKYYEILNTTKDQGATSIRNVAVDSKGDVWITNLYGGVSLFNGNQFTNFTQRNGLAEDDILDIAIDSTDKVYILGYNSLSIYDKGVFNYIQIDAGFNPNRILIDKSGAIWTCSNTYLYHYKNNIWEKIDIRAIFNLGTNFEIHDFNVDNANDIWLATTNGLIKYSGHFNILFNNLDGMIADDVSCVKCEPNGKVYFSYTNRGFGIFDGATFTYYSLGDDRTDYPLRNFVVNKDGSLYFINRLYGLIHYDFITNHIEILPDSLMRTALTGSITMGKANELWIGTRKGLVHFSNNQFNHFTKTTGIASNHINTIYFDAKDNAYAGTWDGISSFINDQWFYLGVGNCQDIIGDLNGDLLCTILDTGFIQVSPTIPNLRQKLTTIKYGTNNKNVKDKNGVYWLPTTVHTVIRFDGLNATEILLDPFDKNTRLRKIAINPVDNIVYLATLTGIYKFDQTKFTKIDGLNIDRCKDLAFNSTGDMYLLMRDNSTFLLEIFKYDKNNKLTKISNLKIDESFTYIDGYLFVDSKDRLWFGYDKGLYKLEAGTWTSYSTKDGLLSDRVSCIAEDNNSAIWIGTYLGICVLQESTTNSSNASNNKNELEIYPNPCSDLIYFNKMKGLKESDLVIEIFDVFSNKVFSGKSILNPVNCSAWFNGSYYYRIKSNEKILGSGKLLKI